MTPSMGILGGGMLGRAVAEVAAGAGVGVTLWTRRRQEREALAARLKNVTIVDSVAQAAKDALVVVFAVPASALREVAEQYGDVARGDQFALHAVRGVCPGEGFVLPHRVLREESCVRKIGVLGGPLYAPELEQRVPLAAVLASRFDETQHVVRAITAQTSVRIHSSRDVVGVEVAGAMSNVTAIAAGMAEGLELGDTARGVLLTRGLAEAARLGVALGGDGATFSGLAGVGDLIPRQVTSTDRHRNLGRALATGATLDAALAEQPGEVEGILTASKAPLTGEHHGVELSLARAVNQVLQGEVAAAEVLDEVLSRHLDLGRGIGA